MTIAKIRPTFRMHAMYSCHFLDDPAEHPGVRIRHHRQQPGSQRDGPGPVHAGRQPSRLRPVHLVSAELAVRGSIY